MKDEPDQPKKAFVRKLPRSELSYEPVRGDAFKSAQPRLFPTKKSHEHLVQASKAWTPKKRHNQRHVLKWLEKPRLDLRTADGPSHKALRLRHPSSPITHVAKGTTFNYIRARPGWSAKGPTAMSTSASSTSKSLSLTRS